MLRHFFRVLSFLPGLLLTLLIAAGSIGPDDALANLKKWATILGIEHIPTWVTDLIIDSRLFWVALIALSLYLALIIVIFYFPNSFAIAIACLCLVTFPPVAWVLFGTPAHIFIECDERLTPPTVPRSGIIYNITIYNNPIYNNHLVAPPYFEVTYAPAGSAFRPEDFFGIQASPPSHEQGQQEAGRLPFRLSYECGVTNYSTAPLFSLHVLIDLIYLRFIMITAHGEIISKSITESPTEVIIPQLGIGPERTFTFYIFNLSIYPIRIVLPQSAGYQWAGSRVRRTVVIDYPDYYQSKQLVLNPPAHPTPP